MSSVHRCGPATTIMKEAPPRLLGFSGMFQLLTLLMQLSPPSENHSDTVSVCSVRKCSRNMYHMTVDNNLSEDRASLQKAKM